MIKRYKWKCRILLLKTPNYKDVNYTFTNYNSINFTKIGNDKHQNAIVYPNTYNNDSGENLYNFIKSKDFNISFWINKRKTNKSRKKIETSF